eukprot:Tamp_28520.p1 GENE.Tamp_28520~~Tamp_28520.p1  ORF type:complete len:184 (-),score=31.70 Tamp_28520:237-788(-)
MGAMKRRPQMLQTVTLLTRLATSPPLVTSKNLFDSGFAPVAVRINEPLSTAKNTRVHDNGEEASGTVTAIAKLCAQMQLLTQEEAKLYALQNAKMQQLPSAHASSSSSSSSPSSPSTSVTAIRLEEVTAHLERVYFRLQRECLVRSPGSTITDVLTDTGMANLFPEVLVRLGADRGGDTDKVW